jgi:hypothetical protein
VIKSNAKERNVKDVEKGDENNPMISLYTNKIKNHPAPLPKKIYQKETKNTQIVQTNQKLEPATTQTKKSPRQQKVKYR